MADVPTADVTVSRVIAAAPQTLYGIVSDLPNMGRLSPENTGGKWLKGATGPTVGARFQGANANNGKHWTTTVIVDQADPGKAFAFRVVVGPVKVARWTYAFEPDGDGTQVTETWTDLRGRFAKFVGGRASGVTDRPEFNRASIEQTLTKLAELTES
jgi:hypothetical protein